MPLIQIKNTTGKVIESLQADSIQKALEIIALRGTSLPRADLRGLNLAGANLQGLQCPAADFSKATLDGANLRDAHLPAANFTQAALAKTDFRDCNIAAATFAGVDPRSAIGFGSRPTAIPPQYAALMALAAEHPSSADFIPPYTTHR